MKPLERVKTVYYQICCRCGVEFSVLKDIEADYCSSCKLEIWREEDSKRYDGLLGGIIIGIKREGSELVELRIKVGEKVVVLDIEETEIVE